MGGEGGWWEEGKWFGAKMENGAEKKWREADVQVCLVSGGWKVVKQACKKAGREKEGKKKGEMAGRQAGCQAGK